MMRSGLVGLLMAVFSVAVGALLHWLLYRWCLRHVPSLARHRRWLVAAMVTVVVLTPGGRWLVNAGLDDRWMWLEGVGQMWGMSLLVSVPAILAWEAIVKRAAASPAPAPAPDPDPDPAPAPAPSRREALVGGAVVGAAFAPLLWGSARTRFDVEIVEVPVVLRGLPRALDGFSIVQVSDIHIGAYLGDRELRRAEDLIAPLRPDLVVMTGDLVHLRPSYLPVGLDWLRRLGERARFGSISILGNHEYYTGRPAVIDGFEAAGLPLLINASRTIARGEGGGLVIAGVDDVWGQSKGFGPDLRATLEGVPPDAPKVLLCHQPQYHPYAAANGFGLQLSGHTHGGQIAPYGPVVARAMFGAYKGRYRIGDSTLYVNRGFGTSGPPSRVAVRPEITRIVLVAG